MTAVPSCEIKVFKKLPFSQFRIPSYQRPYKWTKKNVLTLINDLDFFQKAAEKDGSLQTYRYRLGTLILHQENNDVLNIVDGQQRILSLILLVSCLEKEPYTSEELELRQEINSFSQKYSVKKSSISDKNLSQNLIAIEEKFSDYSPNDLINLRKFICNNCEFVIIKLSDISEAFQFFDSQNSRGKELEPHDLLKAYHLREIPQISQTDLNIIEKWQDTEIEDLSDLFLALFRAKTWGKGLSAKRFTDKDIDCFKGVRPSEKNFPAYALLNLCDQYIEKLNTQTKIINQPTSFPFQLEQICINGRRFFEMYLHYSKLYDQIKKGDPNLFESPCIQSLLKMLQEYDGCNRVGDQYVHDLFNVLILYYVDKFGTYELEKIIQRIFLLTYGKIRLENNRVFLSTIDKEALKLFAMLHRAKTPSDLLTMDVPIVALKEATSKVTLASMIKHYTDNHLQWPFFFEKHGLKKSGLNS